MGDISIRELRPADTQHCTELWIETMAAGYEDRILLENIASGTKGTVGLVAEHDGEIAGFGAAHIGTFADSVAVPYRLIDDWPHSADQQVKYIDVVSVDPAHQNQGIGSTLIDRMVARFRGLYGPIVTETREREGIDGNAIASKMGFETVLHRDDYWSFSTHGYDDCPECNNSPCQCSGTLFGDLLRHPETHYHQVEDVVEVERYKESTSPNRSVTGDREAPDASDLDEEEFRNEFTR